MKVIDVSYASPPTQQQCDCLKAQGIGKAIVGTSYNYGGDPAKRVAAYKKGGLLVAEYQFPDDPKPLLTDEYWVDAENPPGATRDSMRRACSRDPHPAGIYSSRFMWASCGLDGWDIKSEFPFLKLWLADYGSLPRPLHTFGGFQDSDVVMVQYQNTTDVCGLEVDLSITIGKDEDDVTQADKDEIVDRVTVAVLKAIGTLPDGNGDIYKQNITDLAFLAAEREVAEMVKRGQVEPPKP